MLPQKVVFVLGSYEYLERLEGKVRDGIFFCVNKSDNYSVSQILVGFWLIETYFSVCYFLELNERETLFLLPRDLKYDFFSCSWQKFAGQLIFSSSQTEITYTDAD